MRGRQPPAPATARAPRYAWCGMSTPARPEPGASLSEGQYEFTGEENLRIDRAGASSTIWAMCAIVGAVLLGTLAGLQFYLHNPRGAVLVVPLFLICAVAGWLYLGTGRALKAVVTTQGNDVELLMRAPDPLVFLVCLTTAVLVAPLTEEVLFRLVLQGWLESAGARRLRYGNLRSTPPQPAAAE